MRAFRPAILSSLLASLLFLGSAAAQDVPGDAPGAAALPPADGQYVAEGNSVLRLDDDGVALWRTAVSGTVTHLDEQPSGVSVVSSLPGGLSERIRLGADGQPQDTVRFALDEAAIGSARQAAMEAEDPAELLESDPFNPWLHVAVARDAADPEPHLEDAIAAAGTFYDLAGVARAAYDLGHEDLAAEAMELAMADFSARGYDLALLSDPEVNELYGFPLQPWQEATGRGDVAEAEFWSRWLPDEASPVTGPERFFRGLGRSGWYMFAAIVVAILALQVTLTLKYWAPQGLALRRNRETGGASGAWQRLLAIRFFSVTEKTVLALLYVAGLAVLGLTGWAQLPAALPAALQSGTLASTEARAALDDLDLRGPRGEFILGYASHTAGDAAAAELHYRAAPEYGPALNNLGILTGDAALVEAARRHSPANEVIRQNTEADSGLRLVAPTAADFRIAQTGNWQQALASPFTDPLLAYRLDSPLWDMQWVWYVALSLYLLLGVITILWILIPRPAMARNAPRSAGYHLFAVLVPGSGMADEVWGILLLVPWALFGTDLVWRLAGRAPLLDVTQETLYWVLGALYALNLAAVIVEYISYRRRMRALTRQRPDAAAAYGRRLEGPRA